MRLLLLPGMDGTGDLFDRLRAVIPSDVTAEVVTYPRDRFVDYPGLVAQVRWRLGACGPTVLVAESFSGPIAAAVAAAEPVAVTAIVLASSFVTSPKPWAPARLAGALAHVGFRLPLPLMFGVRRFLLGRDADDAVVRRGVAAIRSVAPGVLARRVRAILAVDARPALAATRQPLLCLVGSRDRVVGASALREILACRADAQVCKIDAPHGLLQAAPAEAWAAIRGLLLAGSGSD